MNVDVTFRYVASVLGPRQRSPRPRIFSETMTVEVRETDIASLPVAMRWSVEAGFEGARDPREVRWDGESLWQRLGEGGRDGPVDITRLLALTDHRSMACRAGLGDPFRLYDSYTEAGQPAPFMADDPTVTHVRATGLPDRRAAVEAAAASLLLVDGLPYAKAREPVLQVRRGGLVTSGWITVQQPTDPLSDDSLRLTHGDGLWRADEAAYMASNGHAFLREGWEADAIEVLVPEAVRSPLREVALLRAGRETLSAMGNAVLDRDKDFFAAYADLRDAGSAFTDNLRMGCFPAADEYVATLSRARSYLPSLRRADDPGYPILAERLVNDAIDRYDARAFSAGFAP